jgi:glycine/D-amino acid oxidase-like deaminating enzyme/nitrite reductase/ring-hydroxylating ferredoxin subunit
VSKVAIGGGETSRTTAHLSNAFDDRYHHVEKQLGADAARLVADSHTTAIDEIERIASAEQIDCAFERLDGYLFSPDREHEGELELEIGAAIRAGLADVAWIDRAPIATFDTGRCLRWPRQAQFHPMRYLLGLAREVLGAGGAIHTATHATKVEGTQVETRAGGPVVTADHVVVATNTPINDRLTIHTKQAAYRTYVIAGPIEPGSLTRALYWDTADPYHYVRLKGELLIVGGEDHKTGQDGDRAQDRHLALEEWARARFPQLGSITHRWSGQVMEPVDGVAFIGRNPGSEDNVWIATGDSGQGMTHGAIAGMLLRDLILGRENPWTAVYHPDRKTPAAAGRYLEENANMAAQYRDWVTPGEVDDAAQIAPGAGAILREGLTKVAVYKDRDGLCHRRSAVCPHLGGLVRWNADAGSWDCPAHGSRFDPFGKVINGPANADLGAAEPAPAAKR